MKKFFALMLAAAMMLTVLAGCAKEDKPEEKPEDKPAVQDVIPTVAEDTLGAKLWASFQEIVKNNPDATAEELAGKMAEAEGAADYGCMVAPVNAEYMPGFADGFVPSGYAEGAGFMPMIGSIPFVGYIFKLAEDADVAAFAKSLTDNANPNWNICTTADQVVVGSQGSMVMLLMCPASDEGNGPGFGGMTMDLIPEIEEGTMGAKLWDAFNGIFNASDLDATALDLANEMVKIEDETVLPFNCLTMEMTPETEFMMGFKEGYKPTGFANGAQFMPMIGSIPFMCYIFEVEEGADAGAFAQELADNANPNWNICTTADQVIAGSLSEYAFLLMCPASAN